MAGEKFVRVSIPRTLVDFVRAPITRMEPRPGGGFESVTIKEAGTPQGLVMQTKYQAAIEVNLSMLDVWIGDAEMAMEQDSVSEARKSAIGECLERMRKARALLTE